MSGWTMGRRPEWAGLAALAVAKLALLAVFGPLAESDWGSYSDFADLILQDRSWLGDPGLAASATPMTIFRSMGYPLVVAGFRGVFGAGPAHLVLLVLAQIAVSLAVTVLVWRLAVRVLESRGLAGLAAVGHATGIGILYDQMLLSDSLYASLFITCWSVPLIGLLERRRAGGRLLAGLGVLFAFSCLVRGTGLPFIVFVLPALALWARIGRSGRGGVAAVAIFLAPVIATIGTVTAWNHARSGHWLMTTGAQFVMIQPLVKAAGRGHAVFDGDTPIDVVARETLRRYDYPEVVAIVGALFDRYRLDAVASAELHKQVYFRAWRTHPGAMIENTVNNFNNSVILQFLDPLDTASFYARLATGRRLVPADGARALAAAERGDMFGVTLFILAVPLRVIAYALVVVLALGGLRLLGQALRRRPDGPQAAVLWLWAIFFGYTLSLCAIHMVGRFMPAILPAGLIVALFLARPLVVSLSLRFRWCVPHA